MAIYTFDSTNTSIVVMALQIEKAGLPLPTGMTSTGAQVSAHFASDLSAAQQTTLAALFAGGTMGTIPTSVNSIYTWDDFMDLRSDLRTALAVNGISFDIYPSGPSQYRLIFNKVLTSQDRNRVTSAVAAFLKQVQ